MSDATEGHDWAAPGSFGEPSVGPLPDAPLATPGSSLGTPSQYAPPGPVVVTAVPTAAAAPTYRSWQPGILPLRPMSFGEFLSVPFKAIRYNRAVIIGGPLLCVGVSMVLLAAAMWLAFTDPSLALLSPTGQLQGIQTSTVVVAIAAFIALILADTAASAVVAPGVARAVLGERISVGEAFRVVWQRVGHLVLLWLLSGLAVVVAFLPGAIFIAIGAAGGEDSLIVIGALLAIGLGLVASVPIYIISVIARCVVVLERKGAVEAIRRARGVIKGRFWWSVLITAVTGTIIYIVTAIFQQLLSFVGGIGLAIGFSGEWAGTAVFVAVTVLGMVISYVLSYAYMGSVYALIYIDARIRHEGFDLDLARAAEARRG